MSSSTASQTHPNGPIPEAIWRLIGPSAASLLAGIERQTAEISDQLTAAAHRGLDPIVPAIPHQPAPENR